SLAATHSPVLRTARAGFDITGSGNVRRRSPAAGPRPAESTKGPDRTAVGAPRVRSGDANVLGLRTLGAGGEVELDLLVLIERLVAVGLDRGEVDEDVLAAAILSDEAETLF